MVYIKNSIKLFLISVITLVCMAGVRAVPQRELRYAKAPNGADLICVYLNGEVYTCYPKVFQPTHEFQTILEGQEVPKGLHIQIDMQTGERKAKINDPTEGAENSVTVLSEEGNLSIVNDGNEEAEAEEANHPKVEIHQGKYSGNGQDNDGEADNEDSSDSDDDQGRVKIDYQEQVSFMEIFQSLTNSTQVDEKIEFLEQLEDIVHHIEFGQELMKSLPQFLPLLTDENNKVRALAAMCIGSSLQNNPKAQKQAIKQKIYASLMTRLKEETDVLVLKRLCYAFSNLVRGNVAMIKSLHRSSGLISLYDLYTTQPVLQNKLEIFIADIFDTEKIREGFVLDDEILDQEGSQLWCTQFQTNILSNKGFIPDTLNALSIILPRGKCASVDTTVKKVLQKLPESEPELYKDFDLAKNINYILSYPGPSEPSTANPILKEL